MIKFTKNPTRRILFLFPILDRSSFSTTQDEKRRHKNQPFDFPPFKARGLPFGPSSQVEGSGLIRSRALFTPSSRVGFGAAEVSITALNLSTKSISALYGLTAAVCHRAPIGKDGSDRDADFGGSVNTKFDPLSLASYQISPPNF
jgi:hypothetical protein